MADSAVTYIPYFNLYYPPIITPLKVESLSTVTGLVDRLSMYIETYCPAWNLNIRHDIVLEQKHFEKQFSKNHIMQER